MKEEKSKVDIHTETARILETIHKKKVERGKAMQYAFMRVFGTPEQAEALLKGEDPPDR